MAWKKTPPTTPGIYRWRSMRQDLLPGEKLMFVGYTNGNAALWQGTEPTPYARKILRACKPDEYLHADRLTVKEWGGEWLGPLPSNAN